MADPVAAPRVRILRIITRMIIGGAQENAMLTCALMDPVRFENVLVTGPETGAEGSLLDECRARGIRVEIEPALTRSLHPFRDPLAVWRLYRRMRRERWDVVHVHTSKAGIVGRVAAWLAGVPLVVHTAHGWAFSKSRRQPGAVRFAWVLAERVCARMCRWIVVVAEADRREAEAARVGSVRQFRLIRSGIDLDAYRRLELDPAEARRRAGIPADAFVAGTVGRLSEQKAPLDLLRAFALATRAAPHAHLLMVGDGPLRVDVERAARELGIAERVHLTGVRRDVPELMRAMDVFVLASHWEGLPRVFPQAMAAGLPIVATRVNGAVEAVAEGETGRLADVGDVESLARHIAGLMDDPAARRRMGTEAARRADGFSAARMVEELESLYAGTAPAERG